MKTKDLLLVGAVLGGGYLLLKKDTSGNPLQELVGSLPLVGDVLRDYQANNIITATGLTQAQNIAQTMANAEKIAAGFIPTMEGGSFAWRTQEQIDALAAVQAANSAIGTANQILNPIGTIAGAATDFVTSLILPFIAGAPAPSSIVQQEATTTQAFTTYIAPYAAGYKPDYFFWTQEEYKEIFGAIDPTARSFSGPSWYHEAASGAGLATGHIADYAKIYGGPTLEAVSLFNAR